MNITNPRVPTAESAKLTEMIMKIVELPTTEKRGAAEISAPLGRRLALFRLDTNPGRRFGNLVSVSPLNRLAPISGARATAAPAAAENGRSAIGSMSRRGRKGGGRGEGTGARRSSDAVGEERGGRARRRARRSAMGPNVLEGCCAGLGF